MKFVFTEEELKEAITQYLQDYRNNIFGYKDLDIKFHQSGFKLEHPLVADVTFSEDKIDG